MFSHTDRQVIQGEQGNISLLSTENALYHAMNWEFLFSKAAVLCNVNALMKAMSHDCRWITLHEWE